MSLQTYRAKIAHLFQTRPRLFRRRYRARLEAHVQELTAWNAKLEYALIQYADEDIFCRMFGEKDLRAYGSSIDYRRAIAPAKEVLYELNEKASLTNGMRSNKV